MLPVPTIRRHLPPILLLAALAACATPPPTGDDASAITDPEAQVVRSAGGAVAAASVPATQVGARVLAEGGNAVDAAVATAFALAVTEPSMSGLGGRASMVIRTAEGEVFGIDGLNQVPQGYRDGTDVASGFGRAAVPGVPAALVRAQEEHGSWPLSRVMQGAIRLAEEGFALPADEAARWASAADEMAEYPASRATFLRPDGTPYEAGDHFRNPAIARTLRAIAEGGADAFYRGWIADSIHVHMERGGGFVTRGDLADYRALDAILVRGEYRGHELISNFRPSSGHSVVQALQTMQALGPAPELDEEVAWAALLGQSMHWALQDRSRSFGSEEESARVLTSAAHARDRASRIMVPGGDVESADGSFGDRDPGTTVRAAVPVGEGALGTTREPALAASASDSASDEDRGWRLAAEMPGLPEHPEAWRVPVGALVVAPGDRGATTAMATTDANGMTVAPTQSNGPSLGTQRVAGGRRAGAVVGAPGAGGPPTAMATTDANGMTVAHTQSNGPSLGTKLVASGLGFAYATRLGSEPGSRPSSTISPTLVLNPDGSLRFALGGAGDSRIITAVIQVVSRVVDHGMSLVDAVAARRAHPADSLELRLEEGPVGRWNEEEHATLRAWGFEVDTAPSSYYGRVHAVEPPHGGEALGVAEPRWTGSAVGPAGGR